MDQWIVKMSQVLQIKRTLKAQIYETSVRSIHVQINLDREWFEWSDKKLIHSTSSASKQNDQMAFFWFES